MSEASTTSTWNGWDQERAVPLQQAKKKILTSLGERKKEFQVLLTAGWTEESEGDRSKFDENIDTLINQTTWSPRSNAPTRSKSRARQKGWTESGRKSPPPSKRCHRSATAMIWRRKQRQREL